MTPPVVAYTGNAGTYTVDQTVNIVCTATDNLSGVASTTCANVVAPAFTFGLGDHPFSATATDFAGNTGGGSTSFTVEVTPASLCNLTRMFSTKPQVGDSLCAKLDGAASAATPSARAGKIGAFINEVSAQSGKAFDPSEAALLIGFASAL